ncbi:DUF1456 family protein [Aliiglaciecola sp. 3_MG-2023]|uniref:DUF1456 family protein n=1 Tax=Aliiglaciecola sp. 3_MG-2023 TaxID=3062644 RepID=UPI0026E17354|nr:DUF1456 family protein [Aliiglaciecola sp. 3_MG-2023]MDO6692969.1 DUF1456 family protein [Aliiglaciecola sp. 3_MG-2023]
MNHNDILRRLRFALSLDDPATIAIFKLANYEMEKDYLSMLMKKEEEPGFMLCRDKILSLFLDGLIIQKRGKQEGVEPVVLKGSQRLSNNDILRKIRIAMSYRDEDMLTVLKLANFRLSKGELSAMFRKPDHRNYKESGDQVVRYLLKGMTVKYRPDAAKTSTTPVAKKDKYKKANTIRQKESAKDNAKSPSVENNSVWGKVDPK